jgi:hypothetical protein
MPARELIRHALSVTGTTRGFDIVYIPDHGFDVVRKGKTEIEARMMPEGLLLTALDQPEKRIVATNVIAMWNFIEGHIRSLVPPAKFEGETEG